MVKEIRVGNKTVQALAFSLGAKNLLVLKGSKGYVMCGYLDLAAADAFGDVAVKIVKVATIDDALAARVSAVSNAAKALGIKEGDDVRHVLEIIA